MTLHNNGIDSILMTNMIIKGTKWFKKICFQASTSPDFAECGRQSPESRAATQYILIWKKTKVDNFSRQESPYSCGTRLFNTMFIMTNYWTLEVGVRS
jgi:hypothetical protein